MQSKKTDLREEKIKDSMDVQKEEIVKDLLELLMRGDGGEMRKIKRAKKIRICWKKRVLTKNCLLHIKFIWKIKCVQKIGNY